MTEARQVESFAMGRLRLAGFLWLFGSLLLVWRLRARFALVRVRGRSIEDTFHEGDLLLVKRWNVDHPLPAPDDVIVFRMDNLPHPFGVRSYLAIKRVDRIVRSGAIPTGLWVKKDGSAGADSADFGSVPISDLFGTLVARFE